MHCSSCEIFRSGTFFWCKALVHKIEQGCSRNVVSACSEGSLGIVILNFPLPHRPNLAGAMGQANHQKKRICSLFSSYFRKPHKHGISKNHRAGKKVSREPLNILHSRMVLPMSLSFLSHLFKLDLKTYCNGNIIDDLACPTAILSA